jgi:hypothetical protein
MELLPVSQGTYGATHEQPVDALTPYTINELVQLVGRHVSAMAYKHVHKANERLAQRARS